MDDKNRVGVRFDSGPLTTTLCHAVLPKDVYTLYCHIGAIFAYFGFSPELAEIDFICDLGQPAKVAFCQNGKYLLSSEGDLVDCRTGEIVLALSFPQKEYPKN